MKKQQNIRDLLDICEETQTQFPELLDDNHLPGPMCMKKLSQIGVFNRLDLNAGYSNKAAISTQGRSNIVSNLIPTESIACLFTAAWVWIGGNFPENIDVIDYGHRRKKPHGHAIRAFRRHLNNEEYVILGKIRITTPERTICDLAYTPSENEEYEPYRKDIAHLLISKYSIDLRKCKHTIDGNPYFPGSIHARNWIRNIAKEANKPWK